MATTKIIANIPRPSIPPLALSRSSVKLGQTAVLIKQPSNSQCTVGTLNLDSPLLVVQSLSCVQLFATPWTAACQVSPSVTISQSLFKFTSIESMRLSNHLILCCPLFPLPSVFPSIRVFSNESALHIRWPTCWSFSFGIGPSNEYSGLIAFMINWFDLLAVQETLKSLLQHHNLNASVLRCSAFFMVQLSHPYMTTGKTLALTIWNSVSKVMSLLFNMPPRFAPLECYILKISSPSPPFWGRGYSVDPSCSTIDSSLLNVSLLCPLFSISTATTRFRPPSGDSFC